MQVSFGGFVLDFDSRELRRGSDPVRLSPKALQLLQILVAERPKALSKADLQNRLWPDTFVVEKNLANLISEIREALGEDPVDPRFIRTVPRYGYAFREAAVDLDGNKAPVRPRASPWRMAALALAAAGLIALAGYAAWALLLTPPSTGNRRIMLAVLPFQNLTGDPEQQYVCDGLTEEMIAQLGAADPSRLGVIARTSAMQYRDTTKRADEIARELAVAYLLEMSVRQTGSRVLVTARLIDGQTQGQLWADQYEHEGLDPLTLQREVAAAVARRTLSSLGVSAGNDRVGAERHSSNPAAYEHYLRGRFYWLKDSADGLQKAQDNFQKAIELDPSYARAYSGLADTYALLGSYGLMPIGKSHPLGREAALKALKLDESLAEAHRSLAAITADYYWDWPEVDRHYRRALALDPNDVTNLGVYAFHLAYTGRSSDAVPIAEQACRLDPVSPNARTILGSVLQLARRPDDALRQFEEAVELDPNFAFAHALAGMAYTSTGMSDRAIAAVQKARGLDSARPDLAAMQGYILARAGHREGALKALEELRRLTHPRQPSPFHVALVYVGLDDTDRAIEWLEKAIEARAWESPMIKANPIFDRIRLDPRFPVLLRRIGLPE
jgi:TolB-like protein/DNA-binding winged helix-turn-helix (wHTH) protein/Tfp pilus assembly protein PilF